MERERERIAAERMAMAVIPVLISEVDGRTIVVTGDGRRVTGKPDAIASDGSLVDLKTAQAFVPSLSVTIVPPAQVAPVATPLPPLWDWQMTGALRIVWAAHNVPTRGQVRARTRSEARSAVKASLHFPYKSLPEGISLCTS